jgi:hypothetical protein
MARDTGVLGVAPRGLLCAQQNVVYRCRPSRAWEARHRLSGTLTVVHRPLIDGGRCW